MISSYFVLVAVLLNIWGATAYSYSTIKGSTKPNRVTWSLWALAPLIAFAAEVEQHVGLLSLMTFVAGFGPLLVLAASFVNRAAFWRIGTLDFACGGLSLLALVLWAVTRRGDVAIALSIAADLLAAIPTIIKSYKEPETENHVVFRNGFLGAGITLLTVKSWTFANYGFPIYILCVTSVLYALVRFRLGISVFGYTPPTSGMRNE